uniref:Uncharacterized protein n=1 Tax=Panagrolaimus sp. ES5 TaxID=591445 RepID=A0AC34FSZ5_9BILA
MHFLKYVLTIVSVMLFVIKFGETCNEMESAICSDTMNMAIKACKGDAKCLCQMWKTVVCPNCSDCMCFLPADC